MTTDQLPPRRRPARALTGSVHLTNEGVRNAQMLRNYMNDGGKVIFSGPQRLGAADVGTGTGLNSYSGYSWWQDPVYGFDYPPDQAGDDDRPHTAFFRELDISNDWAQWFLGVGARQGGIGTTTYNAAAVEPAPGGLLAGMSPITLDTTPARAARSSRRRTPSTGLPEARPKSPTRLRNISSITPATSGRSARSASRPTTPARRPPTAARSSPPRTPSRVGFGLEQITDPRPATSSCAGRWRTCCPTAADTTAPTVTWLRPGDGATVNVADPVEIEVEAVDDRGDIKEVRLGVDGQPVEKKVSFPFQLRWQPSAADIGLNTTLTATVEDKAGNVATSTRPSPSSRATAWATRRKPPASPRSRARRRSARS